jgi:hypothetical protein
MLTLLIHNRDAYYQVRGALAALQTMVNHVNWFAHDLVSGGFTHPVCYRAQLTGKRIGQIIV